MPLTRSWRRRSSLPRRSCIDPGRSALSRTCACWESAAPKVACVASLIAVDCVRDHEQNPVPDRLRRPAAPLACRLEVPIRAAKRVGWDVCLILTPSAHRQLTEDAEGEIEALEELTGHPVRWQYKPPRSP